uniref:glutathione transferase n=1 Tax=Hyphantria cunea TaxID=39466 RepID=Q4ACU7_HYPCU|nr:glutathione S-transferase [Hyphantria cunea]
MPNVKFYYFPVKGPRREPEAAAGLRRPGVRSNRISSENWPEFNLDSVRQMPVLEIDGKQYAQSTAICRYLGRKYGLAGANNEEAFEIDQNVEFLNDIRASAASVHYEKDEAVKAKKKAELEETKYPFFFEKLNEILTKNNGHIALGKLTWGDFVYAGMYDYLKAMLQKPDLEQKYPAFRKPIEAVLAIPKVKAYVDAAPRTEL